MRTRESYTGQDNPGAKVNNEKVHEICNLLATTLLSQMQIAIKLRTSFHVVRSIYSKRNWTHISKHYTFKDRRPSYLK